MARAKLWHVAAQRIPDAGMEGFIIYGRAPVVAKRQTCWKGKLMSSLVNN